MARTPEHADVHTALAGWNLYLLLCADWTHPSGYVLWNHNRIGGRVCVCKFTSEAEDKKIMEQKITEARCLWSGVIGTICDQNGSNSSNDTSRHNTCDNGSEYI